MANLLLGKDEFTIGEFRIFLDDQGNGDPDWIIVSARLLIRSRGEIIFDVARDRDVYLQKEDVPRLISSIKTSMESYKQQYDDEDLNFLNDPVYENTFYPLEGGFILTFLDGELDSHSLAGSASIRILIQLDSLGPSYNSQYLGGEFTLTGQNLHDFLLELEEELLR